MKLNKKGTEKILSIWWFFVLAVIGGGIVLGVLIYYSAETSIKKVEAEVLNEKIFDCVINNGYLNEKVFDKNLTFNECKLNEKVFGKGSNFFFKISVYDRDKLVNETAYGDYSFEKNCPINEKITTKRFPGCYFRNKNVLNKEEKELKLIILTASNQEGERISAVS
jgi:hypothetical protein